MALCGPKPTFTTISNTGAQPVKADFVTLPQHYQGAKVSYGLVKTPAKIGYQQTKWRYRRSTVECAPIFCTKRLLVRTWRGSDQPKLLELYGLAKVIKWVDDGSPLTEQEAVAWMAKTRSNYLSRGYGMFAIDDRKGGELLGFGGLVHPNDQVEAEVKYAFFPNVWGSGVATEFVSGLLSYAQEEHRLNRVIGKRCIWPFPADLPDTVVEGYSGAARHRESLIYGIFRPIPAFHHLVKMLRSQPALPTFATGAKSMGSNSPSADKAGFQADCRAESFLRKADTRTASGRAAFGLKN